MYYILDENRKMLASFSAEQGYFTEEGNFIVTVSTIYVESDCPGQDYYLGADNITWVLDLESAKLNKLKEFENIPKEYIYQYYDDGTQLSLAQIRTVGNDSQKAMVAQVDAWMNSVLTDYYTRRYMISIATTKEELDAISSDLSNNNASRPNIELSNILNAGV